MILTTTRTQRNYHISKMQYPQQKYSTERSKQQLRTQSPTYFYFYFDRIDLFETE